MEDLVWVLLVAFAAGVAAAIALGLFVVAATIAAICVFGASANAFLVTMYRGVIHRGGGAAASGPGEPSFRAYYRGQVWRDLRLAAIAAWTSAKDETEQIRHLVPVSWDAKLQTILRLALTAYAFVGLAIGAALALVVGLVPALAIALFAAGAWALGAPLRGLERLRRKRSGAYFDCQECHDRFALPRYACPTCTARHSELAPGPFGVLRHRCTCGARLPAVQFRGRERLAAECPQGHALGEGVGTIRTFHVPVAGGPSTGKSTYLAAALFELDQAATSGTLATNVLSTSRQAYDRILDRFRSGALMPKTDGLPPAMVAEICGRDKSALLYAYDVAGEIYAAEDELRRDPAHGLAEGVVLLIDPFALERVKSDLQDAIDATPQLQPSLESPQRMLERLTGVLEEQGIDLAKINAAVCVTKVDAFGIGDAIGRTAGGTDHERTRAWLEQEGAGNFIRAAESAFGSVRCFGVSALGRMPGTGTGAFAPIAAAAPLLWLLGRAGIEPVSVREATETTTQKIAVTAPLDVSPKRPIFTGALDAIVRRGYVANFAIGLAVTGALFLALRPFTTSSHGSFGQSDVTPVAYNTPQPTGNGADPQPTPTGNDSQSSPPDNSSAPAATTPPLNPNIPSRVARRHFQRINSGDYQGAFELMSTAYRNANPNWSDQPAAAQPYLNVTKIGPTQFDGNGVAYVAITFYGHDRNPTASSDTRCRRFTGEVRTIDEGGTWRYDPGGNHLTPTVLPSTLGACNPQ